MDNNEKYDVFIPGHAKCPKCNFYLISHSLNPINGEMGMDTNTPDNCPNDGTEMMPVKWKDYAKDLYARLEQEIVKAPKNELVPKIDGNTSDGYHTFNELYDHRCLLWINYCLLNMDKCYLVPNHFDGWFLLGMKTAWGQISYHCPNKFYGMVENFKIEHPEFDGHTPQDVINRLESLAVNNRFGSSGKRPLDREALRLILQNFVGDTYCENNLDFTPNEKGWKLINKYLDRICKEFSTAEVSEETIVETILKEWTKYERLNVQMTSREEAEKLAKAIKRELDGK